MTPSEFKAWFEGFTEAVPGVPTKAQWARIKTRVAEIDGRPITEHVYLHRYWNTYPIYCNTLPVYTSQGHLTTGNGTITLTAGGTSSTSAVVQASNTAHFDSHAAMAALGRAESVQ